MAKSRRAAHAGLAAPAPVRSVVPSDAAEHRVRADFRALLREGHELRPAGTARDNPGALLGRAYTPRYRVDLFGARFYLTHLRQEDQFRFFVAYVRLSEAPRGNAPWPIYPRIFYKDSSLIWRCASHYIASEHDQWIGKGAVKPVPGHDDELFASAEDTTNLPFELQAALDDLSRRGGKAIADRRAIALVLRRGPHGRVEPYADFSRPRERAMAQPAGQINGGRDVAWFDRPNRPESLRFAPGFAPDLAHGLVDACALKSRLYGGDVIRYRIVSRNRLIQYAFVAGPHQVWILPPQTLTRELMSYGLRTIDVPCDENLCLPGFEFHYRESGDGDVWHSQIPEGFAGAPSAIDPSRADTSPWNERMPIIRSFRKVFSLSR
jgi:hypothetical protein